MLALEILWLWWQELQKKEKKTKTFKLSTSQHMGWGEKKGHPPKRLNIVAGCNASAILSIWKNNKVFWTHQDQLLGPQKISQKIRPRVWEHFPNTSWTLAASVPWPLCWGACSSTWPPSQWKLQRWEIDLFIASHPCKQNKIWVFTYLCAGSFFFVCFSYFLFYMPWKTSKRNSSLAIWFWCRA